MPRIERPDTIQNPNNSAFGSTNSDFLQSTTSQPLMSDRFCILIDKSANALEVIETIRSYSSIPVSVLAQRIAAQKEVYSVSIAKENFYAGIKEFMTIVKALESKNAQHRLTKNGLLVTKGYIEKMIERVDNLSLGDIR